MAEKHGRRARNKPPCPTYRVWSSMKTRCNNPNDHGYEHYGARGIKVCKRWNNSFLSFLADMGERPSSKHSIDRINNKKGYSPSNCRWATIFVQNQNRGTPKNNTSEHKGINKVFKGAGKYEYWEVRIQRFGKRHSVGTFKDLDKAIQARDDKLEELDNAKA